MMDYRAYVRDLATTSEIIPYSLSPGMKFFMDIFQSVLVNMGVYLGGGNVGVAEHHLHCAQIGTVAEKMGGKRMADHMRRDIFVDAGGQGDFSNYLPESQAGHAAAASGDKEIIAALAL